ncbi:hypothetical protein ABGN05_29735 [Aquibium sp. LZ166]|uniref:Transposase n=1 Tax=Aquibium pacificus TaxID=3153579 RepID=A0ABV3SV68_9HYPH
MDRFPGGLSYSPRLLIGFDTAELDHGGRLSAMSGARPLVVVEGDPTSDACLGPRAGLPVVQVDALIQMSWLWLQHQPHSALTQWFKERLNGGRMKKSTIVAMARKLMVALWKYVTSGFVMEGVAMKQA